MQSQPEIYALCECPKSVLNDISRDKSTTVLPPLLSSLVNKGYLAFSSCELNYTKKGNGTSDVEYIISIDTNNNFTDSLAKDETKKPPNATMPNKKTPENSIGKTRKKVCSKKSLKSSTSSNKTSESEKCPSCIYMIAVRVVLLHYTRPVLMCPGADASVKHNTERIRAQSSYSGEFPSTRTLAHVIALFLDELKKRVEGPFQARMAYCVGPVSRKTSLPIEKSKLNVQLFKICNEYDQLTIIINAYGDSE
ncbi:unnamed protein product [Caenorhabditis auriculariae]|uniref:Uncharacterized protein n=1 Tax=Caenorhabditis auriculariae TaxID=2777116 RepID=A0A8S1HC50_9PELO|nr:unnamed protein product [Caenorhabditis auriculariae]